METLGNELNVGDLVKVSRHWKGELVATGLFMGLTKYGDCARVIVDSGKIEKFNLTFYYLEKLN